MRGRILFSCALTVAAVCGVSRDGHAQVLDLTNVFSAQSATLSWLLNRPTISPYASLGRTDNAYGGAFNYQRNVGPAIAARQAAAVEQARQRAVSTARQHQTQPRMNIPSSGPIRSMNQAGPQQLSGQMVTTGHSTSYGYFSHYYQPQGRNQGQPGGFRR